MVRSHDITSNRCIANVRYCHALSATETENKVDKRKCRNNSEFTVIDSQEDGGTTCDIKVFSGIYHILILDSTFPTKPNSTLWRNWNACFQYGEPGISTASYLAIFLLYNLLSIGRHFSNKCLREAPCLQPFSLL